MFWPQFISSLLSSGAILIDQTAGFNLFCQQLHFSLFRSSCSSILSLSLGKRKKLRLFLSLCPRPLSNQPLVRAAFPPPPFRLPSRGRERESIQLVRINISHVSSAHLWDNSIRDLLSKLLNHDLDVFRWVASFYRSFTRLGEFLDFLIFFPSRSFAYHFTNTFSPYKRGTKHCLKLMNGVFLVPDTPISNIFTTFQRNIFPIFHLFSLYFHVSSHQIQLFLFKIFYFHCYYNLIQ